MHTPTHLLSSHRHASCCIECVQRPLIQMRLIQAADTSDNPLETDLQEMATIDAANEVFVVGPNMDNENETQELILVCPVCDRSRAQHDGR
mmetsp:Transcript_12314/g.30661  ORF Transcript_12314/g.30661 Transcript_12314/m.30661 type:complete len:91 (+) Transcript_12314:146-418(+)